MSVSWQSDAFVPQLPERWMGVAYRDFRKLDGESLAVAIIGVIVAIIGGYLGVAVVKNYWPWAGQSSPAGPASLPDGYVGTWSGNIDVPFHVPGLGPSAAVVIKL